MRVREWVMAILTTIMFSAIVLALILILLAGTVIPAIIAFRNHHRHKWAITALTILGGWTGILWIVALIWSLVPVNAVGGPKDDRMADTSQPDPDEPMGVLDGHRRLSDKLLAGIVILPMIYSWFTLRKGYSTKTRVLSIGYAFLCVAVTVICVSNAGAFMYGLKGKAEQSNADAKYAVDNRLYMVTTPEEIISVLDAGRDDALRRRILLIDGTIASMKPDSGHTEMVIQGAQGGELTMNGDYLVGLKPGSPITAACAMVMHIGPIIRLPRCMVAPKGQMPLPAGVDIAYGVTLVPEQAPLAEVPVERPAKPTRTDEPVPTAPMQFPTEDASDDAMVKNPFN